MYPRAVIMAHDEMRQAMELESEDFPYGKLPTDMNSAELVSAMRDVMGLAFTYSFNSDTAHAVWVEIERRMINPCEAFTWERP